MTLDHLLEPEHASLVAAAAAGDSLLDRLRAQQRDYATGKSLDLPITGRKHPELVARYRFLDVDETQAIAKRIDERGYDPKQFEDRAALSEDILFLPMIEACEGLFAREGDKLEPVDPDGRGAAKFDGRLETFFDLEPSGSAREAILVAFLGNGHAALAHARKLQSWFGDTSKTAEQLLGEA